MTMSLDSPLVGAAVGIGLRAPHVREIIERSPALDFLEIHSENYFSAGGPHLAALRRLRADYPISAHGVGLSLGSAQPVSELHLARLARLVEWLEPALISEHLSWGASGDLHLNDLLPLPYSAEALAHMVRAVDHAQARLRRRLSIENVSSYLQLPGSDMSEWEFLVELAKRSGCGILLDVNNIYVSACNHGFDPLTYIDAIPSTLISELHVAGHSLQRFDGVDILVDTHDQRVCAEVWSLLHYALRRCGPIPVLVEWDSTLPALTVLENEAATARACLDDVYAHAA